MQITRTLAFALVLTMAGAAAAKSDEVFLCGAGTLLYVDSSNRACLRDHPCVRAWFEEEAKQRAVVISPACNVAFPNGNADDPTRLGSQSPQTNVPRACPLGPAGDHNVRTRSGAIEIVLPVDGTMTDITNAQAIAATPSSGLRSSGETARLGDGARTVHVRAYYRKDGTFVRAHTRSPPGSGRSRR